MFFGLPGSLNDLNVLDLSPLLPAILSDEFPPKVMYEVNGKKGDLLYILADGIYPSWALFAMTIPSPETEEEKNYSAAQESALKDVERAFGVLQAHFMF